MSRESSQKVNSELFSLEPTALLEFFVIYYNYVERPDDKLYIHGGTNGINTSIYWQGVEYLPFPIESSEFESKGDGSLPRPKLAVSNQDFFVSIPECAGTEQIAIEIFSGKDSLWGFDFLTSCQRDRTPDGRVRGTNATSVLCRLPIITNINQDSNS